jgi:protein-export membrane protein, secD/secF family
MSKERKSILSLMLLILAVIGFGYLTYVSLPKIKLGLDLAGGVSITYKAKEANPSDTDMDDTVYKLQQRVEGYSTEAEVYREGNDRINIDIPGVSDANKILEELGKPGSLVFIDYESGQQVITGDQVKGAEAVTSKENSKTVYYVKLTLTDDGAKAFAEATTRLVGKNIAIIYDNTVVSNPVVQVPITNGEATITGMETAEKAEQLASTIRIGSLKTELVELRSNVVGAKLGQEAISTSLKAAAIGFAILIVFMLIVYAVPGLASVLGLTLYVELVVCLLAAFKLTLTLPGIAGIVLSIGMAVDANVIIFTRIKEEIGGGKSVDAAIKAGFSKALSAIIDGNITTIIAAIVLFALGSGTVKGFATTLGLGIVVSMFTALFITRTALNSFYVLGAKNAKLYGSKKDGKVIDFLSKRYLFMGASVLVIIAGIVSVGMNEMKTGSKFNYGIDFKGGTSTNVTFNENLSLEDISARVVPVVETVTHEAGTQTQKVEGTNEVIIKTRELSLEERDALNNALVQSFGVDAEKITAENISAAVSTEMKKDAIWATVWATLLMLIYIFIRFKKLSFALGSVLALIHDVLILVTCYAIARWSVGSTFIACILTIVGYSINATIVIFDRMRENLGNMKKNTTKEEIVNLSITQTLSRSINASLTTFIMVLVLYIMGVSSIREFALPIMVGIVVGTYSSVCLAASIWYMFDKLETKSKK